jgi:hypothetical protein
MRSRIALAVVLVGLIAVSASAARPSRLPRSALTPNAVAFRDRLHGILGSGWQGCEYRTSPCRTAGAISVTSNGGRTWRVVRRTARPVVYASFANGTYYVQLDDGETLAGNGLRWRLHPPVWQQSYAVCPQGWNMGIQANVFQYTGSLVVCTGQPGAGNQAKSVYRLTARGWKRVADTGMTSRKGHGGISSYGYPIGIASNFKGFGVIWESRGTLYVTRDGGHEWHALPRVSRPEEDFGQWADVVNTHLGFVVLAIGGSEIRRLVETTDAGRTWRIVRRWR